MSKVFVLYSRNKKDFELRKRAAGNEASVIGGYSSTIGNAHDLLDQSTVDSVIITSDYHIPRVRLVMNHYRVAGKIMSAEKILGLQSRKSALEPLKILLTLFFLKFHKNL
ncbi:MAG: hypothetical protein ABI747_02650 [Candidatus Moraniibacteriota bacterium]